MNSNNSLKKGWGDIKMKKRISFLLVLVFALSVLAGCTSGKSSKIVKVGLGQLTSIAKSADLAAGKGALGQVDTVMAAVGFDKDGKVVSVTIDNAQTKVQFNDDLTLKTDVKAPGKTKIELGDAYGMKAASKIGKEWYQQMAELEKWMVGKTVAEIKAMKVKKGADDAHPAVPDVAELSSLVSITVQDYIACVEEAFANAVEVKGAVKVGLGHNVSLAKSAALNGEKAPLAQVDTVMAVAAFDKDGKVVKAIIDNAQTKVTFDKDGKVTADKKAAPKTKVELKEDYKMKAASKIGKEWYEQAAALGKWMEGKTVAEIKGMKVKKGADDAHPAVPDVAELSSTVSITVQDYLAAVEEASTKAK
jgi:hypothetical protein